MNFGHPLLLLTLAVPLLAAAAFVIAQRRPARHPVSFTNLDVLAAVAGGRSWRRWAAPVLFLLALAALCVGVARPYATTRVTDERATVILVIDASRSMQSTDVRPSRLVAAERAANTFLDKIPKRLRVALIVFSGDVQVATPPTTEHELVRESISSIGNFSGFGGTAIGDAIVRAVEVGRNAVRDTRALSSAAPAPRTRGLVTVVFLSDGRQNRGIVQPFDGARRARAAGIPVNTVALGTNRRDSGPGVLQFGGGGGGFRFNRAPDPATLRRIARITGGRFFEARTAGSVESVYAELGSQLGRKTGKTEVTFAFLIGAAVLLAGAGAASAVWSPRIP
jgi:Ca-activated chloride channel family protein